MLKNQLGRSVRFLEVSTAFDHAMRFKQENQAQRQETYRRFLQTHHGEMHVVLLGRPYTVLVPSMNKGIPDIFARLEVDTFYQEMLSYTAEDVQTIAPLLADVHWYYAARILEAAAVVAQTGSAYPVLVTAFKCTPDSFVIDYFKKIMTVSGKPFAILQLDEHDSKVGYETRVEAAVAAFREHHQQPSAAGLPKSPAPMSRLRSAPAEGLAEKTLVFPNGTPRRNAW